MILQKAFSADQRTQEGSLKEVLATGTSNAREPSVPSGALFEARTGDLLSFPPGGPLRGTSDTIALHVYQRNKRFLNRPIKAIFGSSDMESGALSEVDRCSRALFVQSLLCMCLQLPEKKVQFLVEGFGKKWQIILGLQAKGTQRSL